MSFFFCPAARVPWWDLIFYVLIELRIIWQFVFGSHSCAFIFLRRGTSLDVAVRIAWYGSYLLAILCIVLLVLDCMQFS